MNQRTPSRRDKTKTKLADFTNREYTIQDYKVLGSDAYVTIPEQNRGTKLDDRAWCGTLVGYDRETIGGMRVYVPELDRVITSRDVKVRENVFTVAKKLPLTRQGELQTLMDWDVIEPEYMRTLLAGTGVKVIEPTPTQQAYNEEHRAVVRDLQAYAKGKMESRREQASTPSVPERTPETSMATSNTSQVSSKHKQVRTECNLHS